MPTYAYRCARCGAFDLVRSMADVAEPATCPQCGEAGRRVWGAPGLRAVDPGLWRAFDADARRADTPDVVASPPPRRGRSRHTTDPRHLRLPRP